VLTILCRWFVEWLRNEMFMRFMLWMYDNECFDVSVIVIDRILNTCDVVCQFKCHFKEMISFIIMTFPLNDGSCLNKRIHERECQIQRFCNNQKYVFFLFSNLCICQVFIMLHYIWHGTHICLFFLSSLFFNVFL